MQIKPLLLADLDDTLFQTLRKLGLDASAPHLFRIGAVDLNLKPRSFMTPKQSKLVDWMLQHAELIPVTARGTAEIQRVEIEFKSWAVTTHGAVILSPDGTLDLEWQERMLTQLSSYHDRLVKMQHEATVYFEARAINAFARINFEYDVPVYLVMKHRDSTKLPELYAAAVHFEKQFGLDGFYVHQNSNNIAWLPNCVEKGQAVQFLLDKLQTEELGIPVIGLGDSISDHSFLRFCDWWGTPQKSQFATEIEQTLNLAGSQIGHNKS